MGTTNTKPEGGERAWKGIIPGKVDGLQNRRLPYLSRHSLAWRAALAEARPWHWRASIVLAVRQSGSLILRRLEGLRGANFAVQLVKITCWLIHTPQGSEDPKHRNLKSQLLALG